MKSSKSSVLFSQAQYDQFSSQLKTETALALEWAKDGKYTISQPPKLGCELEACLAGDNCLPLPLAEEFLQEFASDSATHEMGRFNVEFNLPPLACQNTAFSDIEKSISETLTHAHQAGEKIGARVFLCGILPTLTPADFISPMITQKSRYQMLERQLQIMKQGNPFAVNLGYGDGLQFAVNSAVIEAAATSFQIHLEIDEAQSAAFYNAAQAAAAVVLAAAANSPFFMGRRLWAETRVPLFEQILYERFSDGESHRSDNLHRRDDIFGLDYLSGSLTGLFEQNQKHMPPLLPITEDLPPEKMHHLSFHNGTIWRWNRPVMGFSDDGQPALRIEHRPLPSGPTAIDMAANMTLFIGLVYGLAEEFSPAQHKKTAARLPFKTVRKNFYGAARNGLDCDITWFDKKKWPAGELLTKELLSVAAHGLSLLPNLDQTDSARMLDVIRERALRNQNGAQWQVQWMKKNTPGTSGMAKMTHAYWENQSQNRPVHEWNIE